MENIIFVYLITEELVRCVINWSDHFRKIHWYLSWSLQVLIHLLHPIHSFRTTDMAQDTAELIDHLGWSEYHVIGISMGTSTVLQCNISRWHDCPRINLPSPRPNPKLDFILHSRRWKAFWGSGMFFDNISDNVVCWHEKTGVLESSNLLTSHSWRSWQKATLTRKLFSHCRSCTLMFVNFILHAKLEGIPF